VAALAVGRSAGFRRRLKRLLAVVPLALLVGMAPPNAAAQNLEPDRGQEESIAPVSSINDFRDIGDPSNIANPNYWAYRQLSDLIKEHGCVAGFPDGTFKGEQPATRFEVATLIKACLDLGISIHEGNHTHDTNNTSVLSEPTPHPHEPAEHGHDTVAEHEHLIDPSGHTHENIVPHPHEPAEHEHLINLYILISIIVGIIAFIVYQYFILKKIKNLEKAVEEISQNRKPTSKDLIILATGIISMIAASMPIIIHLLGVQGQEAGQRSVQQEMALRGRTLTALAVARSPTVPEDRLAAILSLPGRTVETRVILSQGNTGKTHPPLLTTSGTGNHSPSISLPLLRSPPTG